jgi:nucleoside-diphosphate-sugar epimerase
MLGWAVMLLLQFPDGAFGLATATSQLRTVLVTGGAGYIGSHTCLELLDSGMYKVVVIDNLDNSCEESLERVQKLTNSAAKDRLVFRNCDIRDSNGVRNGKLFILEYMQNLMIVFKNDKLIFLFSS